MQPHTEMIELRAALYGPNGLFPHYNLAEWRARFKVRKKSGRRFVYAADVETAWREIQEKRVEST